jgi:hypothetical protein
VTCTAVNDVVWMPAKGFKYIVIVCEACEELVNVLEISTIEFEFIYIL